MGRTGSYEETGGGDDFFSNPIVYTSRPFLTDVMLPNGLVLSPQDTVLELEFMRKLHHFEKRREVVTGFLGDVAIDMADERRTGSVLPDHVVGYTFKKLANVVERAFGFTTVEGVFSPIPEVLAQDPLPEDYVETMRNIEQNSNGRGEPVVVHMPTPEFIARFAPSEV